MPLSDNEIEPRERPIFWVGAAGFSAELRAVIEAAINQMAGPVDWRLCYFGEADAWLVNGAKCRLLPNGNLRISPAQRNEISFSLDMGATDRPVAFAKPITSEDLEPAYTFDASSTAGVQQALAKFDFWLGFSRAQFVLGAALVEQGAALRRRIVHVSSRGGTLLAMLDLRHGEAALHPRLYPELLQQAAWATRPESAGGLPPGFVQTTPARLEWNYVSRSERNLLPERYRDQPIYYRRAPRVPLTWLHDSHLRILQELYGRSATLSELADRTGLRRSSEFERALAGLFYAGAVTTTATKATPPSEAPTDPQRPLFVEDDPKYLQDRVGDPTVPGDLSD